jgi:hypothetical protein
MITHLRIEGPADIDQPSRSLLGSLLRLFGTPDGPTYVILTGPDNQYVQAAGSAERFVLESRDQYGEGFLHLRGGTITGRMAPVV